MCMMLTQMYMYCDVVPDLSVDDKVESGLSLCCNNVFTISCQRGFLSFGKRKNNIIANTQNY